MLENLWKAMGLVKPSIEIGAPVAGEVVPISEVSDPTFGEEILGKGIAIRPTQGRIVSPVDGVIETMFDTGHAVSINGAEGPEVLVHVGLDTIRLKGKYYTVHKKSGDAVKKGDLLIEFDLDGIRGEGYDVITPVVICNSGEYNFTAHTAPSAKELDNVISLTKKN